MMHLIIFCFNKNEYECNGMFIIIKMAYYHKNIYKITKYRGQLIIIIYYYIP